MKDFEQRDAGKNVGHPVVAIPPERDARHEQAKLHRIRPVPLPEQAHEVD